MRILVDRIKSDSDSTLSIISIDGEFECFGLEDAYHKHKIPKKTRIPPDIYVVGVRKVGGFHTRYFDKFPSFHQGMLQVMDVPNFDFILIHIGNFSGDTEGCLLVGCGASTQNRLTIQSSKIAYKIFYKKVIQAALNGDLTVEYRDSDL